MADNETLLHLDLSECGLSGDMILAIAKAVKHCISLVGIHFSGNPGLNQTVIENLLVRMEATYEPKLNMTSFLQTVNRLDP